MNRVISLVFMILLSCVSAFSQGKAPKLSDGDQVRLIVFTELLKAWLPEPRPDQSAYSAKAFYFQIENKKDASKDLLAALGKARVPFRQASRSFISDPDGSIVLDKKSRERGILFTIYSLAWKGKDEAVVHAGNHEGNMSAFECTYLLRRDELIWRLVSAENCMIS